MGLNRRHPDSLLRELTEQLGLDYEPQDWGIANANGERVEEFISFLDSHPLEATQRFELAGLILASMNERLLDAGEVDEVALGHIVQVYRHEFEHHVSYWRGLTDNAEFPLGSVLRRAAI